MKKTATVIAMILMVLLVLTACGGSDKTTAASSQAASSPSVFGVPSSAAGASPSVPGSLSSAANETSLPSAPKPSSPASKQQNTEKIKDILNMIKDSDKYLNNEELPEINVP